MSAQILTDVNDDFDMRVNTLVKIKDDINNDAATIKKNIKEELFTLDNLGRKNVMDEITNSKDAIMEQIIWYR